MMAQPMPKILGDYEPSGGLLRVAIHTCTLCGTTFPYRCFGTDHALMPIDYVCNGCLAAFMQGVENPHGIRIR